jgi:hypothetical protein
VDKKETLSAFGENLERFEEQEKHFEEFKKTQNTLDSVVLVWFDKNGRFAVSKTARLYNANDIAAFNIPVLEPKINCKATPGFLPKMKAREFNEAIRETKSDLAIPIFADDNCIEDCLGFVICRGGEKFEILDSNPFGENEYSKDELFHEFKMVREKSIFINKTRGSSTISSDNITDELRSGFLLDRSYYSDEQKICSEMLKTVLKL